MLEMKNEAEGRVHFTRQKLEEYGGKIRLFPDVKDWFGRTRRFGKKYGYLARKPEPQKEYWIWESEIE